MKSGVKMQKISGRILIADDNPVQIEHLRRCLNKTGFDVYFTADANEVVDIAEGIIPDLILLDVVMPEIDGYTVCEALKSKDLTKDIPIIFITSKSDKWDKVKGFSIGAFDYITKPFFIEEAVARIRNAINLKQFQDDLKKKNSILEILSIRDELTLLYNRRYVLKRLDEEIERTKRYNHGFSCIMVDIDFFKKINDNFGHPVGDIALRNMGELLRKNLRAVDIAARYDGEEFLLILPETDQLGAKIVAEKLRRLVESGCHSEGLPEGIKITVSLGIAVYPNHGGNRDRLIKSADEALYMAKEAGRNCCMVYEEASGLYINST